MKNKVINFQAGMGAEQNSISGKLSLFINNYPNLNFLTSPCAMESGDKGRPYVWRRAVF